MALSKKDKLHNCWGVYETNYKLRMNILCGKKTEQVIGKIILANDFTKCHITWMADIVKEKLLWSLYSDW